MTKAWTALSMDSANSRIPTGRSLLVVRLGSMGDVIHTLPALSAMRRALPEATIGWVIEERWAELLCTLPAPRFGPRSARRPLVDKVHTVDTKGWRKNRAAFQTWEQIAAGVSELRAAQFEIAADFQGAIRSALIARCSGAPVIFGFSRSWEYAASMFYSRKVAACGTHIVEQNLSLASAIVKAELAYAPVVFPRNEEVEQQTGEWLRQHSVGRFAILNPGAGWGAKRWPAARYAEVARELESIGVKSLINYGPGEEELAGEVESTAADAAIKVASSITQLISLTRRASLFIGGDTGPMHLAAACGVPVVAIFGPTDPARNGPFATPNVVLRSSLSSTTYSHGKASDRGILSITVAEVIAAAARLLREVIE
jgi:heptosyltransferase-1